MRERGHPPPFFPPRYGLPAVPCPVCHPPTTNASLRTIVGRCSRPVCLKRNRTCNSNSRLPECMDFDTWSFCPESMSGWMCGFFVCRAVT